MQAKWKWKFSGGDPRESKESAGGICESRKFKMAAVGQFDRCVLNGLDLGFGVIWGKEFIYDVRFIVLQPAYR